MPVPVPVPVLAIDTARSKLRFLVVVVHRTSRFVVCSLVLSLRVGVCVYVTCGSVCGVWCVFAIVMSYMEVGLGWLCLCACVKKLYFKFNLN